MGLRLGGAGGARLEDRVFELPTVLGAHELSAEALEATDGDPRFPVDTEVIHAHSFF